VSRIFEQPPVLCGHRGSGKGIVGGNLENTLASHRAAVAAGVGWVEVDARITADDVLVARHDPVTADGRTVAAMSTAETDAAGLMRVEELFEDLPPHVGVNVDVKTSLEDALRPRGATTAALVARLVERAAGARRVLVSSFDPSAVLIFREHQPGVPVGLITWTRFPLRKAIVAARHLGADALAAHFASFAIGHDAEPPLEPEPAAMVDLAHRAGLEVVAWCPKPPRADELMAAGVDCVIVDDAPGVMAARGTEAR
jgi:glycerophosphoryl diester phosphodiesterase